MLSDEPTVLGLIRELLSGFVGAILQNKLPAMLAVFAGIVSTFLAVSMRYDERPRYRQIILPSIERAEANFTITMDNAEKAPGDVWRLHYFLTAHLKVNDLLRTIRGRYPTTSEAIAAHEELIRYYALVNEELSIIRTQMSVDERMDYWAEWKRREAKLRPARNKWQMWVTGQ